MTDDKMRRCSRLASAYDPSDWPLEPAPPEPTPDRLSGWLAVATAILAALFIGACLAWGLRA